MLKLVSLETPRGDSLTDITAQVREVVRESGIQSGLCALVIPHTTAAITLNSTLDSTTPTDIINEVRRLVPTRIDFLHQYDTPSDAAGHIKASLIGHSALVIIENGDLLLGGSQSILFYDFDGPRSRKVQVKLLGN